ncbi:MAG: carbohydrate kinase family protein [Halorubrum sp.]
MVRVVTAGHVNWDVTLRVAALPAPDGEARISSQRRSGGGSAANVAAAIAGYGADAGVIGSVGDDEPGFLARRELDRDGIDVSELRTVRAAETTVKYLIVDAEGEVMVLGNEGANEAFSVADIDPTVVRDADHLHLTSQRPETAERLAGIARDAGVTVSFDPGRRLSDRDYGDLPDRVDLLFLNQREADVALAGIDPKAAVAGTDRIVVVKHGANGATAYSDEAVVEYPGFDVDPVDTTGAGDAFAAGFLAVVLGSWDGVERETIQAGDFDRALEIANACGAMAACEEGARTAPTRAEAEEFLVERRGRD